MSLKQTITMEELASSAYPSIWDTSVFSCNIDDAPIERNLGVKISMQEKRNAYGEKFRKFLPQSQFYVSQMVLDEIQAGYNGLKKTALSENSTLKRRRLLGLRRARKIGKKLATSLGYSLQERGKIIDFKSQDDYQKLRAKYHYFIDKHGVSETDLDLLLSGILLARREGRSSVISNDFGILSARNDVVNGRELTPEELQFIIRESDKLKIMPDRK